MNPRHPLIKELKRRIDDAQDDQTTKDLAHVLYETATLRSGYALPDTADFAGRVERMLRLSMNVGLDEKVTAWSNAMLLLHLQCAVVCIAVVSLEYSCNLVSVVFIVSLSALTVSLILHSVCSFAIIYLCMLLAHKLLSTI